MSNPIAKPTRESVVDWQGRLRAAFMAELTNEDVKQILRAQIDQAKAGNQAAARLVLAYGLGGPNNEVEEPPAPRSNLADFRLLPPEPEKLPPRTVHDVNFPESRIAALANHAERGEDLFNPPPPRNGRHKNGKPPEPEEDND